MKLKLSNEWIDVKPLKEMYQLVDEVAGSPEYADDLKEAIHNYDRHIYKIEGYVDALWDEVNALEGDRQWVYQHPFRFFLSRIFSHRWKLRKVTQ
jgi:sensor histidine kinase regulating citrate/malate metabolism